MCGIYGYANLENKALLSKTHLESIIHWLAISNMSRGKDSTGLGIVDKERRYNIIKKPLKADDFFKTDRVDSFLNYNINQNTSIIIGHTRFATTGTVNRQNAMPFKYGKVLGSHNGMIFNYKELWLANPDLIPETECDSEIIFALLNKELPTMEGINKALALLDGCFALAWYDDRTPDKLYFATSNNPLSIIKDPKTGNIFWSSEETVTKALNKQFKKTLINIPIENYQVLSIDNNGITEYKDLAVYDYPKYDSTALYHGTQVGDNSKFDIKEYDRQAKNIWGNRSFQVRKGKCDNCRHQHKKLIYEPAFELKLCRKCYRDYLRHYGDLLPDRYYYDDGFTTL